MMIHEITAKVGAHKRRMRVGRGESSGRGKTSGRGTKGGYSRAGGGPAFGTEGGNMPLFRRLPKRGFNNNYFAQRFSVVNVGDLDRFFVDGQIVNAASLITHKLIRDERYPVKVLGDGALTRKLTVVAAKFSKQAVEKITAAGGTMQHLELDRNKDKVNPKNGRFRPQSKKAAGTAAKKPTTVASAAPIPPSDA